MENLAKYKEYTPEHDALMKQALVPVLGAFDLYAEKGYPIAVKVPEALTFVEFKTGWDQDDYVHNNKTDLIVNGLGIEYKALMDYPRYSDNQYQTALRFFFKNAVDANKFVEAVNLEMQEVA
jgi:hypothetical protein